jgi:hypothetical protein
MRSVFALGIAASASLVAAQSDLDYPYRIDPDSVSSSDRGTCNALHCLSPNPTIADMPQTTGASRTRPNAPSSVSSSPA